MAKPVELDPVALAEIHAEACRLDADASGRGDELLDAVQGALDRIADFPEAHTIVRRTPSGLVARGVTLRRFSVRVVYLDAPSASRVVALVHLAADPERLSTRLDRLPPSP